MFRLFSSVPRAIARATNSTIRFTPNTGVTHYLGILPQQGSQQPSRVPLFWRPLVEPPLAPHTLTKSEESWAELIEYGVPPRTP